MTLFKQARRMLELRARKCGCYPRHLGLLTGTYDPELENLCSWEREKPHRAGRLRPPRGRQSGPAALVD